MGVVAAMEGAMVVAEMAAAETAAETAAEMVAEMVVAMVEVKVVVVRAEARAARGSGDHSRYSPCLDDIELGAHTPPARILAHRPRKARSKTE